MKDQRQLQLDSLLEVSQAINANMPEDSLYKILYFTCISNLNVRKMAIYVLEGTEWECKISHGANQNYLEVPLSKKMATMDDITFIDQFATLDGFEEFDVLVPVRHKDKLLSYVFVAGLERFVVQGNPVLSFIQTISNIVMVAIENKRLARQELAREALRKEMDIASRVQSNLLPKNLPQNEKIDFDVKYLPHRTVGGDYYDVVKISDDELFICIADVSGKGVPAAMLMSNFQASLRTLIRKTKDLKEIVIDLNLQILSSAHGENFITFFGALVNTASRTMSYINAGHNPPMLAQGKDVMELKTGCTILGAIDYLPVINVGEEKLSEGSIFLGYTDGLSEAMNKNGEEFGEEPIEKILSSNSDKKIEDINAELITTVDKFRGSESLRDDLTLLTCRFF